MPHWGNRRWSFSDGFSSSNSVNIRILICAFRTGNREELDSLFRGNICDAMR